MKKKNRYSESTELKSKQMKYLIVGLGNIGEEYVNTRHNIGFDVLDAIAKDNNAVFKVDTLGTLAEVKYKGRSLHLLKPSTYMNRSGKPIKYWMEKLKIKSENLLVVVDDLHLELGKLRLRSSGSDGGHNGLKDIQDILGTSTYNRLRLGIGNDFSKGRQVDFVLGKWKSEEKEEVQIMIEKATKAIKNFASIGIKFTMESLNK